MDPKVEAHLAHLNDLAVLGFVAFLKLSFLIFSLPLFGRGLSVSSDSAGSVYNKVASLPALSSPSGSPSTSSGFLV